MSLISMRQLLDHAAENSYGVPVEQICEGIKNGVRKINIDTDLRLASTGIIRQFLAKNPTAFDPRAYWKETIVAMRDIAVARHEGFGTAGNEKKIVPLGLAVITDRYTGEEFSAQIHLL